jgi:hypothetical protein
MDTPIDTASIKRAFNTFTYDEKVALIRDLMVEAEIDSIVHNNRTTIDVSERYSASHLNYRDNFVTYVTPFLCRFLNVIEEKYIDQCFEVYKILQARSIGSKYESGSQNDRADQSLYAQLLDGPDNIFIKTVFKNEAEKNRIFTSRIFNNTDINRIELICFTYCDIARINMLLTDLFVLLHNNYDHAYIVLMLFGFLDEEATDKYTTMLLSLFPTNTSVKDIIINQMEKLTAMFSLDFS